MKLRFLFSRKSLFLICFTVLLFTGCIFPYVAYAQDTTVHMNPPSTEANPGASFTVDVNVTDVTDLFSWQVKMQWDQDILEMTSATEGPFLQGQPEGSIFAKTILAGSLDAGCTTLGDWPGVSGSGTLMTVAFLVTDPGETTLDIYESTLLNSTLGPMLHTVEDGDFHSTWPVASFTYAPQSYGRPIVGESVFFNASASYDPDGGSLVNYDWDFGDDSTGTGMTATHTYATPGDYTVTLNVTDDDGETANQTDVVGVKFHDIAILDITVEVQEDNLAKIYVTVMNNGSHTDWLNVTLYIFDYARTHFNATYMQPIVLGPGNEVELGKSSTYPQSNFIWNTTDVPPGLYYIWAGAYLVNNTAPHGFRLDEEQDTSNNMKFITFPGTIIHDISIEEVTVTPTQANVGQNVKVHVRVKNEGTVQETFSVNVYNGTLGPALDPLIANRTKTLGAGAEDTLTFSWFDANETTVPTTYNISVHVPPIVNPPPETNETDVADNTFTDVTGTIQLLVPSTLTVTASPTVILVGSESTSITGTISPVRAGATVTLSYTPSGQETWINLANVTSDATGQYSYVWIPWVEPATYQIKASWLGDALTLPAESSTISIEVIQKTASTIELSAAPTTITLGESITIDGSITPSRAAATVTIWHMSSGADWSTLTTVTADEDGTYTYDWEPAASGTYALKASWEGDDVTEGATSDPQIVVVEVVEEPPAPDIFLYSTIGLAVAIVAILAYFLFVRKPTAES